MAKYKRRNKGQRQEKMLGGSLSSPRCINLQPRPVYVCVCLSVFSISAPADYEPEDPLELIEEHKGADITLREGDENTHTV